MSTSSIGLNESVGDYVQKFGVREDRDQKLLREVTASHPYSRMQISPEQGQFMALLIEILDAKRCLEVGVFTGYSAMTVAKAMGPAGKVIALDISEDFTAIAREHWRSAGIEAQIDLRLGPAIDTLEEMLEAGEQNTFDFAFIDADKGNYLAYYEAALQLIRPGGIIGIDNVLWDGSVADPSNIEADTESIRSLNEKLATDQCVTVSMIPIGDGLTLARKR
ncbi:MAG: class I SAM-dependent methyltransferase [Rhodospirillaceae bacterium]